MIKPWKTKKSEIVFDEHKSIRIRKDKVELPSGEIFHDFYLWLEGDVVLIVPITKDGDLLLVKQYKHGAGGIVVEFPAGLVEDNEKPKEAAVRELREETGYSSEKLKEIAIFQNHPTKVVSNIYVYLS